VNDDFEGSSVISDVTSSRSRAPASRTRRPGLNFHAFASAAHASRARPSIGFLPGTVPQGAFSLGKSRGSGRWRSPRLRPSSFPWCSMALADPGSMRQGMAGTSGRHLNGGCRRNFAGRPWAIFMCNCADAEAMPMARLPPVVRGSADFVPLIGAQVERRRHGRRKGGSQSARYCDAVWFRHLAAISESRFPPRTRSRYRPGQFARPGARRTSLRCIPLHRARRRRACESRHE